MNIPEAPQEAAALGAVHMRMELCLSHTQLVRSLLPVVLQRSGGVCRASEHAGVLTDGSPWVLFTCHSLFVDGRLEFTLFAHVATL